MREILHQSCKTRTDYQTSEVEINNVTVPINRRVSVTLVRRFRIAIRSFELTFSTVKKKMLTENCQKMNDQILIST